MMGFGWGMGTPGWGATPDFAAAAMNPNMWGAQVDPNTAGADPSGKGSGKKGKGKGKRSKAVYVGEIKTFAPEKRHGYIVCERVIAEAGQDVYVFHEVLEK